jgi:hypothetical protein
MSDEFVSEAVDIVNRLEKKVNNFITETKADNMKKKLAVKAKTKIWLNRAKQAYKTVEKDVDTMNASLDAIIENLKVYPYNYTPGGRRKNSSSNDDGFL